jgi:hypothetical protein
MLRQGKVILEPDYDDPKSSFLELLPDSRFILPIHKAYLRFGKEQFGDFPNFRENTAGPNYRNGHITILEEGIRQLYTEGGPKNVKLANDFYQYLRHYYPDPNTGKTQEQYLVPLETFVFRERKRQLTSFKRATAIIGSWLFRSLKFASLGEVDQAANANERARKDWLYYMEDKRMEVGQSGRRQLAPLKVMRADATLQFMQRPDIYVMHKVKLWRVLERETRQRCYDRLLPIVTRLCDEHNPPLDIRKAFPEPPGMKEFRETNTREDERPDKGISHGEKS